VVLPLLASDLVDVMEACINEKLTVTKVEWKQATAVCVVMASGGYPGSYAKGQIISGLEGAEQAGAYVFHAGTSLDGDKVVTNGGRVLGVTAMDGDIVGAVAGAYKAVKEIRFAGMHYRNDIAFRAINRDKH
jgi:phosphoribosylamine--glycine ligase